MPTALSLDERDAIETFLANPAEDSFSALFRALSPCVFRYLRLRGCEAGLAEDLTQEVMITVYTQSRTLRNRDLFLPWLFRVTRNAYLQHLRREHRHIAVTALSEASGNMCGPAPDPTRASMFAEWMECLTPLERELIVLRYVEGFKYHEIASALEIPLGTVQWKIFRLKRKLAERFGGRLA